MTRRKYAVEVLTDLHAPITEHTMRAMMAWMVAEGGSAKFNPLNTTLPMQNSTRYNSVGVQNYQTAEEGVEATVRTLKEDGHGYHRIRRRLRLNAPAWAVVDAIIESDWGTGKQDQPGADTVIEQVLDDIQKGRAPNRLGDLEYVLISS
jgi:hypothetical protein